MLELKRALIQAAKQQTLGGVLEPLAATVGIVACGWRDSACRDRQCRTVTMPKPRSRSGK
jgi:hypothetical protein